MMGRWLGRMVKWMDGWMDSERMGGGGWMEGKVLWKDEGRMEGG